MFMKLTKKGIKTKPGILHYTPQSNKALYCRFCLILAFMLGLCTISFAQKAKVTITGMVYDKNFRTPLLGGMVYLHDDSGCIIDSCEIGKTSLWSQQKRDFVKQPDWKFLVEHKAAKYSVEITYPKYESHYLQVDLSDLGRRQFNYPVEDVFMTKSAVKLKDVVVTATKVKFYNKGDTLVYNADAFQLAEGSMLDALVDQLPGVELKDGGRIYVNGKFVENLTLNGRDFFGGNHQLLLENLGAYTVKDIAVYDKLGDRSQFVGRELPGDKKFTMDVRLKKEYLETWMLNAEAGGGTHDRYMGRLFLARNTSHSSIGMFANFNNLSDQGRPGQNTLWQQANKGEGEQRVQHAGMTYSVDGSRAGIKNSGDVLFSRIFTDVARNTMRTNLMPSNTTHEYSYSNSHTDALFLGQAHTLNLQKKYWLGMVLERVNYRKNNNTLGSAAAAFDKEQTEMNRRIIEDLYTSGSAEWSKSLINRTLNEDIVKGHNLLANLRMNNFFKFKKSSDNLYVTIEGNYTEEKNERFNKYQIDYGQVEKTGLRLNDYYNRPINSYHVKAGFSYHYSFIKSGYAQVEYYYTHGGKNTDSYRYRLDRLAEQGVFGTVPQNYVSVLDPLNSYTAHYDTNNNNLVLTIFPPSFIKNVGIGLRPTLDYNIESLRYKRDGKTFNVKKNFLLPGCYEDWTYLEWRIGRYQGAYGPGVRHTLSLKYNLESHAPELMDMVPVTDDADPLNIYVGVSDLKVEMNHRLSLNWEYRPKRANINNTLRLVYDFTSNALTRGYDYDERTGVRTWRSYNTDGNWMRYATNTFSLVFGKNRQFTLSSDTRVENSQAADVIGTNEKPAAQFAIRNWLVSEGLKLAWQIGKQQIGLNGSFIWRNTSSEHDDFASFHATNVNCGLTGQFKLPGNIGLSTDFTLYSRNGYADSRLNTNDFVWNARLSYAFGKGRWVAMLDGYDLLHQLSNVTYGITAQARTISYTNTLPRYCLLHLQYKINITPKVKGRK